MKKRGRIIQLILLAVGVAILSYIISNTPLVKEYLANPEALKTLIISFGILAPLAIILLQAFQTTISIIPSQITTILAGFLFGPILGLIYSLIGAFLGSAFIFQISRKYGDQLALKFFDKKELAHFHHFFKQKGLWALFLARMTPLFPNDLVSFAAGLAEIRFRNFNVVSSFGFVIQMIILTYFGAELSSGRLSAPLIIGFILVSLLFLAVIFRTQFKRIFIKDLHKIEKEIEKEIEKNNERSTNKNQTKRRRKKKI